MSRQHRASAATPPYARVAGMVARIKVENVNARAGIRVADPHTASALPRRGGAHRRA